MSDWEPTSEAETASEPSGDFSRRELRGRIELLEAENRRLHQEYARAHTARYRRTALALVAVGLVALAAATIFPPGREVLLALGGTGLFGGVLTYFLTPGQFVPARVGTMVYEATARNTAAITDSLGLRQEFVYIPPGPDGRVRLFVPRFLEFDLPRDHPGPIVIDEDHRGLLIEATGSGLVRTFEESLSGSLATDPALLSEQIADGVVDALEIARTASVRVDHEVGAITIAVSGSAYGPVDQFDHPVASFVAAAVATGLDTPVWLEVAPGDDRADWLVTCQFDR